MFSFTMDVTIAVMQALREEGINLLDNLDSKVEEAHLDHEFLVICRHRLVPMAVKDGMLIFMSQTKIPNIPLSDPLSIEKTAIILKGIR